MSGTQSVLTHLTQVNLNGLVVFTAIIWDQVIFELISHRGNLCVEGVKKETKTEVRHSELTKETKHTETNSKRLTRTASFLQVRLHAMVVWENGRGGSNFSTHVTDGSHS